MTWATTFATRWQDFYNHAVERLVNECYATDCAIHAMGAGVFHGRAALLKIERAVLRAAPTRFLKLDTVRGDDTCIIIEATLQETPEVGAWQIPFCAVLTLENGLVVRDHTYADWSKWPGL